MEVIRQYHDVLLARPFKHKCTKKFDRTKADKVTFLCIKRPVYPLNNRRLDMLAQTVKFKQNVKYGEVEEPSTYISRAVLEHNCTPRIDHLSRPSVRFWEACKVERGHWGKSYLEMVNDRLAMSLDAIYYHNVKSLMNIAASRKKSSKSLAARKPKNWDEVGDKERLQVLATSKTVFKPRPSAPRKRMKLEDLSVRVEKLSTPRHIYTRPSQESVVRRLKLNPLALTCVASERTKKLTHIPSFKLLPPWIPIGVKRSALFYQLTDYTKSLAEPRPRALAVENDLKENPYDINPWALKCKPTPRIIELAKPKER